MKQDQGMRGINLMANVMGRENSTIKMEDIMKVNGEPIRCMVGENFTMREENLHIKATGIKISFTVLVKFTMTIQSSCNVALTLQISTFCKIIGSIMKECS